MCVGSVQFVLRLVMRNAVFTIVIRDLRCGFDGLAGRDEIWDGMGWDGMGSDGIGWDGMGWSGAGRGGCVSNESRCSFKQRCLAGGGLICKTRSGHNRARRRQKKISPIRRLAR